MLWFPWDTVPYSQWTKYGHSTQIRTRLTSIYNFKFDSFYCIHIFEEKLKQSLISNFALTLKILNFELMAAWRESKFCIHKQIIFYDKNSTHSCVAKFKIFRFEFHQPYRNFLCIFSFSFPCENLLCIWIIMQS